MENNYQINPSKYYLGLSGKTVADLDTDELRIALCKALDFISEIDTEFCSAQDEMRRVNRMFESYFNGQFIPNDLLNKD